MTRWRTTPTNLRLLLLSALGGAVWACGSNPAPCSGPDCGPSDSGTGGGDQDGSSSGGAIGSGGRSGSGGVGTGGAGTGSSSAVGCTDPTPLMDGVDTGIFYCTEGYLHRAEAKACPTVLPRDNTVDWPETALGGAGNYTRSADECSTDADCTTLSSCYLTQTNSFDPGCMGGPVPEDLVPDFARLCSIPGCLTDADCEDHQVCICGELVGQCQDISPTAGCKTDADCGEGFLCLENSSTGYLTSGHFACQLPGDECNSAEDCGEPGQANCSLLPDGSGRVCSQAPVCGRPFLVLDEARRADAIMSPAWLASSDELDLATLRIPADPTLRAELAAHWTEIGLLEHASVAAFARFTLQLLSLGAPADLVEASQRAALDEIRHAELAFALASRYAGRSIGPGPLPMTGALDASSVDQILATTVREGCIGETRAALEASRAAETCEDPVVRSALETIAADEARHAELAWRVVRFIVTAHPETARVLAQEFGFLAREQQKLAPGHGTAAESSRFGVLTPSALERCHREAYRDVIAPCARTLLAMTAAA